MTRPVKYLQRWNGSWVEPLPVNHTVPGATNAYPGETIQFTVTAGSTVSIQGANPTVSASGNIRFFTAPIFAVDTNLIVSVTTSGVTKSANLLVRGANLRTRWAGTWKPAYKVVGIPTNANIVPLVFPQAGTTTFSGSGQLALSGTPKYARGVALSGSGGLSLNGSAAGGGSSALYPSSTTYPGASQYPGGGGNVTSESFATNGPGTPSGWTSVVNLGSVAVTNGAMALTSATGAYAGAPAVLWSAMTPQSDFEVTYDIGFSSVAEQYPTISFRADGASGSGQYPLNGLGFEFQTAQNHWLAAQTVNGTKTQLGAGDFTFSTATRVNVKERFVGSTWQVRLWNVGSTEPTTWDLSVTNAGVATAGKMYLSGNNGSAGTAMTYSVDNINVTPIVAAMPTSEPAGWTRVYSEDFTTAVPVGGFLVGAAGTAQDGRILSNAAAYTPYYSKLNLYPDNNNDTNGFAKYYPSKTVSTIAVPGANGVFNIYLHTETISGVSTALSAWLRPIVAGETSQVRRYTRMSIRMRGDAAPGYGWVMLSIASPWPQNGELDFPEGALNQPVEGWYHYADPAATPQNYGNYQLHVTPTNPTYSFQDWHIYTQEWSPNRVRWFIDDRVVLDTSDRVPAVAAQHVIQSGGQSGVPDPAVSGNLQIDWLTLADYTG